MKKKSIMIAAAVGFVGAVSLFAFTPPSAGDVVTTAGSGIGDYHNPGIIPVPQGGSAMGFANVTAPTNAQLIQSFEQELTMVNKELKDPNITPERKKELTSQKKEMKKKLSELKKKNGKK